MNGVGSTTHGHSTAEDVDGVGAIIDCGDVGAGRVATASDSSRVWEAGIEKRRRTNRIRFGIGNSF